VQNALLDPGGGSGINFDNCHVQGDAVAAHLGSGSMTTWLASVALLSYLVVVHILSYMALKATLQRERR
jgi:hypothetical protein